jgi:uncharacterized protein
MLIVTLALMVLVGVAVGLLGGGGSILSVPVLTFVAAMPVAEAIVSSLVIVAVSSGVAAALRARRGQVQVRVGLLFGGAGLVGAYGGGRLAQYLPPRALLLTFAAMMLATAAAMLRPAAVPRARREPEAVRSRLAWRLVPLGTGIGFATGLVGTGGGFVIVPALLFFAGLPIEIATGTSQMVICIQSSAALVAHLSHAALDAPRVAALTAVAVVGIVVGTKLATRISPTTLRKAFAILLVLVAVAILVRTW